MRLKPFNKNEKKINTKTTRIVVIVFLFIVALVLGRSFALYQKEDVLQVTNGKVGQFCVIGQTWDFPYVEDASGNGYGQEWPVPCDGNYKIELWGAGSSANLNGNDYQRNNPGYGGYVSGNINLLKENILNVYVGGSGKRFNNNLGNQGMQTSGGATDIRIENGTWYDTENLATRIMVAGGAGGSYVDTSAPSGISAGGLISYKKDHWANNVYYSSQIYGSRASSESDGEAGKFGIGGSSRSNYNSGGGGYYGGGAGPGSGAGSSFISGHAGSVAITSKTDLTPRNDSEGISCGSSSSKGYNELGYNTDITCSYHYSGYKFTNTKMIDGEGYNWTTEKGEYVGQVQPNGTTTKGHDGNGYARITYLGYKDEELNGADPILTASLVPVTIENDVTVRKANLQKEWYNYNEKKWANAVVLIDKTKTYRVEEVIPESNIESYFVWIPKYSYKIWDLGNYTSTIDMNSYTYNSDEVKALENKAQEIEIRFGLNDTSDTITGECTNSQISGGGSNCHIGDWMTHPAFSAFNANGLWVAKFETTGTIDNLQSKPGVTSLRSQTLSAMWNAAYNYISNSDSHMMKNTEWGAVAYLSHSKYGINKEVNLNNNSNYLTGYGAVDSITLSSLIINYGTTSDKTLPWNTATGYKASTTGNITGIYDMSGGTHEYVAGYRANKLGSSNFSSDPASLYGTKYFDIYNASSSSAQSYNYRILGDATGEMGPFYRYIDNDFSGRDHNSWYMDCSEFVLNSNPWFLRGGRFLNSYLGGPFYFHYSDGNLADDHSFRLVLSDHNR